MGLLPSADTLTLNSFRLGDESTSYSEQTSLLIDITHSETLEQLLARYSGDTSSRAKTANDESEMHSMGLVGSCFPWIRSLNKNYRPVSRGSLRSWSQHRIFNDYSKWPCVAYQPSTKRDTRWKTLCCFYCVPTTKRFNTK